MSGHTPGPWKIGGCDDDGVAGVIRAGDENVAVAVPTWSAHDGPTVNANARLISAAPDLLAALKYIVEWENGHGWKAETARDIARAAIVKAEGGAE